MNWQKQMESMVSGWTDTQRRLWENWTSAVKGVGLPFPGESLEQQYRTNLEAWERAVQEALARQTEWAGGWSGGMLGEGQAQEAAQRWLSQVQQMMQDWTEAQRRLWTLWFENVQRLEPGMGGQWENDGRQVLEAWQEAATKAEETLNQWAKAFSPDAASGRATRRPAPGGVPKAAEPPAPPPAPVPAAKPAAAPAKSSPKPSPASGADKTASGARKSRSTTSSGTRRRSTTKSGGGSGTPKKGS